MAGLVLDIARQTMENCTLRKVLYAADNISINLMTIEAGQEITSFKDDSFDRFLRVEAGEGIINLPTGTHYVEVGSAVLIPRNMECDIKNIANAPLKLSFICSNLGEAHAA